VVNIPDERARKAEVAIAKKATILNWDKEDGRFKSACGWTEARVKK